MPTPKCFFCALLFLSLTARAQTCTPDATRTATSHTLSLQNKLLSTSSEEMEIDVPPAIKPILHDFKQALIATVDVALRCNNPEPDQLQPGLVSLFHANKPQKPFVYQPPHPGPEPLDIGDYGGELNITVKPVAQEPGLYSIDLTYAIECGTDSILLLYRRTPQGWHRELVYMNPDLNSVGDAVGDFFTWSLVPGPSGQTLFAAAHGHPWCTSRYSGFSVDLIAPATSKGPQKTMAHLTDGYSRGEQIPVMRKTVNGFEFRVDFPSRDLAILTNPEIFHFRTTAGKLERTQPIALNARDFVGIWLDLPWAHAAIWSDPASPAPHTFHDRFDYERHPDGDTPSVDFGPMRACGSDRFQVELDLTEGPQFDQNSTLFALVHRSHTAFTMLSASDRPDPVCTGPDLMKPRALR